MNQGHLLLHNPATSGGRAVLGPDRPADLEVLVTRDAEDMREQARRAAREGLQRVIVAGGDGSLHHAIQGLAGTDCALAILPTGSGNDLARALGIPRDPRRALEIALHGEPRRIDLGRIDDHPFAGVAGLGIDGDVNRYVDSVRRGARGPWVYPWALLRTLRRFTPPRLSIEHDAGVWEGRATLAALANSPYFGGGMRIAPAAELDDGRLRLIVIAAIPKLKLAVLLHRVYRGTHVRHPAVTSLTSKQARLRADRKLFFYADGEAVCPVAPEGTKVGVISRALKVITAEPPVDER